jgi:hypothetical protein
VVFVATSEAQAKVVRDLLWSHGLDVELTGTWRAALRGMLPLAETTVTIEAFSDEDAERARAVLATIDLEPQSEGEWQCPRCGESVPGEFASCWKCGAESDTVAGEIGPVALPIREFPPAKRIEEPVPRDRAVGDLVTAVGGYVAAALILPLVARLSMGLAPLTVGGRIGFDNLVVGVVLAACLAFLRRRGVNLGALWGGRERWIVDLVGATVLGFLLAALHSVVRGIVLRVVPPGALPSHRPFGAEMGVAADIAFLMLPGVGLAAGAGTLVETVMLTRLRALVGVRSALVLTAVMTVAASAWPNSAATIVAVLVEQIVLTSALLVVRRAWPVALASAIGFLIRWLPIALSRH